MRPLGGVGARGIAVMALVCGAVPTSGCSDDETTPAPTTTIQGGSGGVAGSGGAAGTGGGTAGSGGAAGGVIAPIAPHGANPSYWEYDGQAVVLLGSSSDDNLFQTVAPDLTSELDTLAAAGGNYLRCTMSSRDDQGFEVHPFHLDGTSGEFDLGQWNDEYYNRLSTFLQQTLARGIIVQIEIWATWDFYGSRWDDNPWNPDNNSNYTAAATSLETTAPSGHCPAQPFFATVPGLNDDATVLAFQQAFVDQLLSHTLGYPHVLYTMDNETCAEPAWARYWTQYVQDQAALAGVTAYTTEMIDEWDLDDAVYDELWDNPTYYLFLDVSQGNHRTDELHYTRALHARTEVLSSPAVRPINNVKIYGHDGGSFGDSRDGKERFWRNLFAGHAAVRFHRAPAGLGGLAESYPHITSARMLFDEFDLFDPSTMPNNGLLGSRAEDEAYCLEQPGQAFAVFFPNDGQVTLDVSGVGSGQDLTLRWLDVEQSQWGQPSTVSSDDTPIDLVPPATPPESDYWVALVSLSG